MNLCHVELFFPRDMTFGTQDITIHPEICDAGKRHENVYATASLECDPASRLAFRVTGFCQDSAPFEVYLSRNTESAVFRANAFADRVLDGKDVGKIAQMERRMVEQHKPRPSRQK